MFVSLFRKEEKRQGELETGCRKQSPGTDKNLQQIEFKQ